MVNTVDQTIMEYRTLSLPCQRSELDMWAQFCWSTINVLIFHLCYLIFRRDASESLHFNAKSFVRFTNSAQTITCIFLCFHPIRHQTNFPKATPKIAPRSHIQTIVYSRNCTQKKRFHQNRRLLTLPTGLQRDRTVQLLRIRASTHTPSPPPPHIRAALDQRSNHAPRSNHGFLE